MNKLLLLACLAAAFSMGCTRAAGADAGKTFTFRLPDEPETLDWNKAHTPVETYILMNLMEGLVTFDDAMKIQPAVAQSWTVSSDGRTYTFNLRKDVRWSDGVLLTAKDFVYSWKRLLSPLTAASYAYFLFDVENAELFSKGKLHEFSEVGVKAVDDYTLRVKLVRPVAHWIDIPTFWVTFPMREDIVDKYGTSWEAPGKMVTNGPFELSSRDLDSRIVLKANPLYSGHRGNIEMAVGQIVRDNSTALNLYESGKLDLATDLSTLDLKRLEGRSDLHKFPYLKTAYIGFVTDKYPTSNLKVRRAISMAIDRARFGDILHGQQAAATSFVPPKVLGYSASAGLKYDPAFARSELQSSGIDTSKTVTLDLILPGWEKQLTIAQYIQNEVKKNLGLNVVLQPFDHKTFRSNLDLHTYPIFLASWSADYPDPDNFLSLFLGASGNNRTAWKNEKFDDLVVEARSEMNPKIREKGYLQAQKILQEDDAVILPLYYEPNLALVKPRIKGLELNPLNYLLLRKVELDGP